MTPVFENREKGKIDYYSIHVFVALASKQLLDERMLMHVLIQGTRPSSNAMSNCRWRLSFSLLVRDETSASQDIAFGYVWVAKASDVAS